MDTLPQTQLQDEMPEVTSSRNHGAGAPLTRQRYGKGVVAALASAQTDALARDFEDADQRRWIARAIVSSAKSHVAFGLTLKEVRHAEQLLASQPERSEERDWER